MSSINSLHHNDDDDRGGGGQPLSPPQQPPNPILMAYEKFVETTPLLTRYLISLQGIAYLASWFWDSNLALTNIPYFTLFKFEIYRIVTSFFVNSSLFNLLFSYWTLSHHAAQLEHCHGSTAFAWLCLCLTGAVHGMYLMVALLLYAWTGDQSYLFITSASGPWTLIFATLALEASRAPRSLERPLFVVSVPALYYPVALYLLFSFLSGGQSLGLAHLIALGVGYVWGLSLLPLELWCSLSITRIQQWEESSLLQSYTRQPGWIASHAALGSAAWSRDNDNDGTQPTLTTSTRSGSTTGMSQFMSGWGRPGRQEDPHGAAGGGDGGGGGRTLGGGGSAVRRTTSSDTRNARLQALERRQQQQQQHEKSERGESRAVAGDSAV